MLELLKTLSVQQIAIFTVMLALAIKGTVDFFTWCKGKYEEKFNKDHSKKNQEEKLMEHYKKCSNQHDETMILYENLNKKIDNLTENFNTSINNINSKIDQLTMSDMHDIKGWIVEKHHTLIKQGWVDDFTMDTLEKRYADYKAEKGNSYVGGLMTELRALPHCPPEN